MELDTASSLSGLLSSVPSILGQPSDSRAATGELIIFLPARKKF
jgi:hypothetical protein